METNLITYERSLFVNLYRQAARSIHECLPFGMKDEYDIDLIAYILELEDEFRNWERSCGISQSSTGLRKDLINYIIDKVNRRSIFPTHCDIERIVGSKNEFAEQMGYKERKVA